MANYINECITKLKRVKIELKDFLRFNYYVRNLVSVMIIFKCYFSKKCVKSLNLISAAARVCPNRLILQISENICKKVLQKISIDNSQWDQVVKDFNRNIVEKGIILKQPIENEKGVLLVSFENQWIRLLYNSIIEKLCENYILVIAPSWSPPHSSAFFLIDKFWKGTLFTLLSNDEDYNAYKRISSKAIPVKLLASNWVLPSKFVPLKNDKVWDIIVLANFSTYKRHFFIFKMLGKIPKKYKVVLGRKKNRHKR